MKNNKLASLLEELKTINLSGKVGYAVAKNRKLIEDELEILQSMLKETEGLTKYNKERIELLEKHASKDEKGKPIIENNTYKLENQEEWDEVIKDLQETHKDAIEERTKQVESYNKLMEEDINLKLYTITEDQIPDSATSKEVYTLLKLL